MIQMSKTESAFFEEAEKRANKEAESQKEKDAAEWWNFEGKGGEEPQPTFKGYFVQGTYHEKEGSSGPYTCLLAYLRDLDGVLWRAWFSAGVAIRQLQDASPAQDTLVMINYEGEIESNRNAGRKFKAYRVIADEQDAEYWNAIHREFLSRSTTSQASVGTTTSLPPGEAPF